MNFTNVNVPLELVHQILEELHGDPSSLAACSLVSHVWRPSSQCVLLRDVQRDPQEYVEIVKFLSPNDAASAAPISTYVRNLVLKPKDSPAGHEHPVFLWKIVAITDALPQLKSLQLENMQLFIRRPICANPTTSGLDSLSLVNISSEGTADYVMGTLVAQYKMKNMRISTIRFQNQIPPMAPLRPSVDLSLGLVESLVVRSPVYTGAIVDFFSQGSLKTLSVSCSTELDTQALNSFLAVGKDSLEYLSLQLGKSSVKAPSPSDEDVFRLSLSKCDFLSSLAIRVALPDAAALRVVSQFIKHVPESLQSLSLAIALDSKYTLKSGFLHDFTVGLNTHLAWLDNIAPVKPALRKINWVWNGPRRTRGQRHPVASVSKALEAQLTELVETRFRSLVDQGVLSVNGECAVV
ncbi:F-box protein [Phanerochaete sordida]|uniref:F-box protein n=1 Tax=Phanerochaete sordida TaxID=48140 RepID=A0A9P3GQF8_9APHY|nr:F-box protein [Phanerochaete sordida]